MSQAAETDRDSVETAQDVSVIICTLDRPELLRRCLQTLQEQIVAPAEVLVVSGSDASIPPGFAEDFSEVRILGAPGRNLSVSRNAGVREAKCDLLAFCDDDAMPQRAWLRELLVPFASPSVAAVGGTVYDAREVPARLDFACGLVRPSGKQKRICPPSLAGEQKPPRGWFRNVCGCNFALRRSALLEIGGFDEFYEFAFEETDVVVRFARAGHEVAHAPDAVVLHGLAPGGHREDDLLERNWYAEIKNQVYFGLRSGAGWHQRGACIARVLARLVKLRLRWARAAWRGEISRARAREHSRAAWRGLRKGLRGSLGGRRRLALTAAESSE